LLNGIAFSALWGAGVVQADELAPPSLQATSQGKERKKKKKKKMVTIVILVYNRCFSCHVCRCRRRVGKSSGRNNLWEIWMQCHVLYSHQLDIDQFRNIFRNKYTMWYQ
jgi:hypothetical protein